MDCQAGVLRFHKAMGMPINEVKPHPLTQDRLVLRLKLIKEEWDELLQACGSHVDHHNRLVVSFDEQDLAGMADALGDIVYVCFGMAVEMGVNLNDVFREIQRANMAKLDANGNPIINQCQDEGCPHHGTPHNCDAMIRNDLPHGKVIKPEGWTPPNIHEVIHSEQTPLGEELQELTA